MMHRLVLLALALCLASVAARPHHLSPLEHDLADLERGLDQIVDLEEDDEDEDEDMPYTQGPLLVALDCGSSGTKLLLFATDADNCPPSSVETDGIKLCPYVKYTPTMSDEFLVDSEYGPVLERDGSDLNRVETTSIGTVDVVNNNIVGLVAMATAGNRIIEKSMNKTAWDTLSETLVLTYPELFKSGSISIQRTIPGTHEAWYESKTNNGRNFISMGGASAQYGILLKTDKMVTAWHNKLRNAYTNAGYKLTKCNNQDKVSHFITTVASNDNTEYDPMAQESNSQRDTIKTSCKSSHKCIGLVSWLAAPALAGTSDCPVVGRTMPQYVNHYAGGTDGSNMLFKQWAAREGRDTPCFGGCDEVDGVKCAIEVFKFSRHDRLMNSVQFFMANVRSDADPFFVMASLVPSVKVWNGYTNDAGLTNALKGNAKARGGAFFALWGVVGLIYASNVEATDLSDSSTTAWVNIGLTVNSNDWIWTAAGMINAKSGSAFSVNCQVPFKAESYKDKTAQVKDCFVYLDRELE